MKKTIFYSVLCLFALNITVVNAQVRVGSSSNPHPGAVLDLRSDNSSDQKGLLLPRVKLTGANVWSLDETNDDKPVAGMLVYNETATIDLPVGVYVWDGTKWVPLNGGNNPGVPPGENVTEAVSGEYAIQGATCYDRGVFTNAASLKRTYYFATLENTLLSNLSDFKVGFYDNDGLLESVTYNGGAAQKNVVAFDVNFKKDIKIEGNETKTVKIYAQLKDKYVELKITVQNGSCCPTGNFEDNSFKAYAGPLKMTLNGNPMTQAVTSSYFTEIPNTSLCIWKADDSSARIWADAKDRCASGEALTGAGAEDKTGDWRLPTPPELGQLQGSHTTYKFQTIAYWSSTEDSTLAWLWHFFHSYSTIGVKMDSYGFPVRCVRSVGN